MSGALIGAAALGTDQSWIKFLAATGAVMLEFGLNRCEYGRTLLAGKIATKFAGVYAVIPTLIANAFYLRHHHLPKEEELVLVTVDKEAQ